MALIFGGVYIEYLVLFGEGYGLEINDTIRVSQSIRESFIACVCMWETGRLRLEVSMNDECDVYFTFLEYLGIRRIRKSMEDDYPNTYNIELSSGYSSALEERGV